MPAFQITTVALKSKLRVPQNSILDPRSSILDPRSLRLESSFQTFEPSLETLETETKILLLSDLGVLFEKRTIIVTIIENLTYVYAKCNTARSRYHKIKYYVNDIKRKGLT